MYSYYNDDTFELEEHGDDVYYEDPYHYRHAFEQVPAGFSHYLDNPIHDDELCQICADDYLYNFEWMQDEYYFQRTKSPGRRVRMPHLYPLWKHLDVDRPCGWERYKLLCRYIEVDCPWNAWCPSCSRIHGDVSRLLARAVMASRH